jgi:hypothetical protein
MQKLLTCLLLIFLLGSIDVLHAQECNLPAPSGLTLNSLNSTSAQLSWNAEPGAVSYKTVLSDLTSGGAPLVQTVFTPGITYNALVPGHQYKFAVSSNCVTGSGPESSITFQAPVIIIVDIVERQSAPSQALSQQGIYDLTCAIGSGAVGPVDLDLLYNDPNRGLLSIKFTINSVNSNITELGRYQSSGLEMVCTDAQGSNCFIAGIKIAGTEQQIAQLSIFANINQYMQTFRIEISNVPRTTILVTPRNNGDGDTKKELQKPQNNGSGKFGAAVPQDARESIAHTPELLYMPNPMTTNLNIQLMLPEIATTNELRISSMDGRLYFQQRFEEGGEQYLNIETADWPSGLYLMHLNTPSGLVLRKIIKQ